MEKKFARGNSTCYQGGVELKDMFAGQKYAKVC